MARDPSNLKKILPVSGERKAIIDVSHVPEYDIANWDLHDEGDFKRYMKWTESVIRSSFEYRRFIYYLKSFSDMNHCSVLTRVTNQDSSNIKIEIHHEPLTLYDILIAVLYKRTGMREDLDEYQVSKEVMYWHYRGLVGLIPLCELVHELVHNQYIFIPSTIVVGRWKEFVRLYQKYIPDDTLNTLEKIEEISKVYDLNAVRDILEPYIVELRDPNRTNAEEMLTYIKGKLNEYNTSLVA